MSRNKTSISQSPPVIASKKTIPPSARRSHGRRLEAEKRALQALEQSLRLQAYTIGLPRSQPLFSGSLQRRQMFPSAPVHIIRLLKSK